MELPSLVSRLFQVKSLFSLSLSIFNNNDKNHYASLLIAHDAIELFLIIVAEETKTEHNKFNFDDYFKNIPQLTYSTKMKKLNKARVNLKHSFIIPEQQTIKNLLEGAESFLIDNTKSFFNTDFEELNFSDHIQNKLVKEHFNLAIKAKGEQKKEAFIEHLSISFFELLADYKDDKYKEGWLKPQKYKIVNKIDLHYLLFRDLSLNERAIDKSDLSRNIKEVENKINENFDKISETVAIISLGISYSDYIKFKILTPHVTKTSGGTYFCQLMGSKNWSDQNCDFLQNFVFNATLKLQAQRFNESDLWDMP